MKSLYRRSFLTLLDFTPEEINYLLTLSKELKQERYNKNMTQYLKNQNVALIFEKTSTRTRCAFQVSAQELGGNVVYLSGNSQIGVKESIKDSARVLGRMFDGIEYRGFGQEIVETLSEYSHCPVWNGLTDEYHPTQILADFLTIQENFGPDLTKIKLVFFGDARNNMGNSLMIGAAKLGMHFVACAPKSFFPDQELINKCQEIAKTTGATLEFEEDPNIAARDAHVIYTDVWVSMGEPDKVWDERVKLLLPYQVNSKVMNIADNKAIFLHCLPAFHNLKTKVTADKGPIYNLDAFEVTEDVFESSASKVFDQAENRLHTIKAVMVATIGISK